MEFAEVVRKRRMVRTYDPDRPVPREVVDKIVQHGLRAPSAGFSQGWGFLVLTEAADRDRYWSVATGGEAEPVWRGDWLTRMRVAPVLVVCLANKSAYLDRYAQPDKGWTDKDEARWPVPYWHIDTGMAALIILLAAHDLGLGACFFGVPPERWPAFFEAFAVPAHLAPVGVVSLGYPLPDVKSPSLKRGRRQLSDVLTYGSFA